MHISTSLLVIYDAIYNFNNKTYIILRRFKLLKLYPFNITGKNASESSLHTIQLLIRINFKKPFPFITTITNNSKKSQLLNKNLSDELKFVNPK